MVNKKGFEMQFHWIFVLIAGAIILIFFFSLTQKQKSLSEERLAITLSTDIEAIFTGAIQAKGTAQLLRIPQPGIAFSCSEACECNFWIGRKATEFKEDDAEAIKEGEEWDVINGLIKNIVLEKLEIKTNWFASGSLIILNC